MPCRVTKQSPLSMNQVEGDSRTKDSSTHPAESWKRYHHHYRSSSLSLERTLGAGNSDSVKGVSGSLGLYPDEPDVAETLKGGINNLIQLYRVFGQSNHSDGLQAFVDFYCEKMLITAPSGSPNSPTGSGSIVQVDSFSCPVCYGIFIEPVTIQCGHSYCRKCLQKERPGKSCRRCRHILTTKDIYRRKSNVLVSSLVEKWWPNYLSANNLRSEGNLFFDEREGDEALNKYSQAIALCKCISPAMHQTRMLYTASVHFNFYSSFRFLLSSGQFS